MGRLELAGVTKCFVPGRPVVAELSLTVEPGEVVALLGPSGSGKTTTLRLAAGLERPTAGLVRIDGRNVTAVAPHRRGVAMVFQEQVLFPGHTVRQQLLAAGRRRRAAEMGAAGARAWWSSWLGQPTAERTNATDDSERPDAAGRPETIDEQLKPWGLSELAERRPAELSGGERRRVALAKAWQGHPRIVLLDEPLAGIDGPGRGELRSTIRERQRQTGVTVLYVTHDQDDALAVANRVAVLLAGRLAQVGTPRQVYQWPATIEVARFVGRRPMNLATGIWQTEGSRWRLTGSWGTCSGPRDATVPDNLTAGAAVTLGVRPERITIGGTEERTDTNRVTVLCRVAERETGGEHDWWRCDTAGQHGPWVVPAPPDGGLAAANEQPAGREWRLHWSPEDCRWFDSATGRAWAQ